MSRRADFLQLVAFELNAFSEGGNELAILRDAQIVPEEKIPNRVDLDVVAQEFISWRERAYGSKDEGTIDPPWIEELAELVDRKS